MPRQFHSVPPSRAESRRRGYAAWRAADEAQRLAIPPAPPDPLPGQEMQRWVFSGQRWTVEVVLQYIGRRARSDQYRVLIDGREWMPCAGVADTLAHLRRDVLPRTASKRQCDEMAREDYRSARQAAEDGTAARNSVKCRHG